MGASACGIVANMPAAFPIRWEFERRLETDKQRLAVALAISLALHGMIYAGWRVAPTVSAILKDAIARVLPKKFVELQPKPKLTPTPKHEVPMVFVEVDPALASKEPPKETKNYSTDNSLAANPKPKDLDVPKIEGSQTHVLRTTDNPKPQPTPLQPAPPPEPKVEPKPPEPKEPEVKPKPPPPIGDLAMNKTPLKALEPAIKTDDKAPEKPIEKPRDKPRTLAEARARNPQLVGQKIQQEGGVTQRSHMEMVDARRSPFGNYDAVFISMVQNRWYHLLDNNKYMLDRRGKVSITFRLHYDGRITQLDTIENNVGEMLGLLCQKALLDPAPFPKWPKEMRQIVGTDYRDVRFTFYYDCECE
jgi:hypothetical protein